MVVKILRTNCAKGKLTQQIIEKLEDILEIMKYNILTTPAVVVDEVVKTKGRLPTEVKVKKFLINL